MNSQEIIAVAKALVADDKGLLAMDESNLTCNKRFAALGIPQTKEARRAYRELILTTPSLSECISGVILYDETLRQRKINGTSFIKVITNAGIIPGIKVDTGAKDMAGHPMVLPGLTCPKQVSIDEVADATVRCLMRTVPAAVAGIAFLSGGQSAELASARLNAMNVRFKSRLSWALAFWFARAIQQPALEIWRGQEANVSPAQWALYHRAICNRAARRGEYNNEMERN